MIKGFGKGAGLYCRSRLWVSHFVRSGSFIGQMHPKIQNWNFFFPISLEMIEDHEIETMLMYNFK